MLIIDITQGTQEWFEAKAGIPSASNFDKIITTAGKPSAQRTKYMYTLAAEAITGKHEETFKSGFMEKGNTMEDEARQSYALITGDEVKQVGFCLLDDSSAGASPDGMVSENGLLEIKCPKSSTHVEYLLKNKLPTTYFAQTQGQLFVTGRKWLDFMSYYEGMRPLIIRVKPDLTFHKALKAELEIFSKELKELIEKITVIT